MKFVLNIRNNTGCWREHIRLLDNLEQVLHLFFMPEVHQMLTPIFLEMLLIGNK